MKHFSRPSFAASGLLLLVLSFSSCGDKDRSDKSDRKEAGEKNPLSAHGGVPGEDLNSQMNREFESKIDREFERDFENAVKLCESGTFDGDGRRRRMVMSILARKLAEKDPLRAIAWVLALEGKDAEGSDPIQVDAMRRIMHLTAETAPKQTVEMVRKICKGSKAWRVYDDLVQVASRKSLEHATAVFDALPHGSDERNGMVAEIARNQVKNVPAREIIEWYRTLPASEGGSVLNILSGELARSGEDLSSFLPEFSTDERRIMVSGYARRSEFESLGAGLDWAETFDSEELRTTAHRSVLSQWSRTAPQEATEHYFDQTAETGFDVGLGSTMLSRFSSEDPEAAARWALGHEGGNANWAVKLAANNWARMDSEAASEWVAELPAGYNRDLASLSLATAIYLDDPDSAERWVEFIEDPELRRQGEQQLTVRN